MFFHDIPSNYIVVQDNITGVYFVIHKDDQAQNMPNQKIIGTVMVQGSMKPFITSDGVNCVMINVEIDVSDTEAKMMQFVIAERYPAVTLEHFTKENEDDMK